MSLHVASAGLTTLQAPAGEIILVAGSEAGILQICLPLCPSLSCELKPSKRCVSQGLQRGILPPPQGTGPTSYSPKALMPLSFPYHFPPDVLQCACLCPTPSALPTPLAQVFPADLAPRD